MNCNEVRDDLSAYLDRELGLDRSWRIEQHLRECGECAREVEELREVIGAVGDLPRVNVPAALTASLCDQLSRVQPERPRVHFLARFKGPIQAFAAVAAVVVVVYLNNVVYRSGTETASVGRTSPPAATLEAERSKLQAQSSENAPAESLARKFDSTSDAKAPAAPSGKTPAHEPAKDGQPSAGFIAAANSEEKAQGAAPGAGGGWRSEGGGKDGGALDQDKHALEKVVAVPEDKAKELRRGSKDAEEREKSAVADRLEAKDEEGRARAGLAKQTESAKEGDARTDERVVEENSGKRDDLGVAFGARRASVSVVRAPAAELAVTQRQLEEQLRSLSASYTVDASDPTHRVVKIAVAAKDAPRVIRAVEGVRVASVRRRQAQGRETASKSGKVSVEEAERLASAQDDARNSDATFGAPQGEGEKGAPRPESKKSEVAGRPAGGDEPAGGGGGSGASSPGLEKGVDGVVATTAGADEQKKHRQAGGEDAGGAHAAADPSAGRLGAKGGAAKTAPGAAAPPAGKPEAVAAADHEESAAEGKLAETSEELRKTELKDLVEREKKEKADAPDRSGVLRGGKALRDEAAPRDLVEILVVLVEEKD